MAAEGNAPKRRVAILGGGMAGLSAAWELTATKELQSKVDVTVYQLGWRLGGKGASGRNAERHNRIEEHGLHVWFGWYEQAFDLISRCYAELPTDKRGPFQTWSQAFTPLDSIVLVEHWRGHWYPRKYPMTVEEPHEPVEDSKLSPLAADVQRAVLNVATWVDKLTAGNREAMKKLSNYLDFQIGGMYDSAQYSPEDLKKVAFGLHRAFTTRGAEQAVAGGGGFWSGFDGTVRELAEARSRMLKGFAEEIPPGDQPPDKGEGDAHRTAMLCARTFDFFVAVAGGIYEAFVNGDPMLTKIDEYELREWLAQQGMESQWHDVPFLRGAYDLTFAYPEGDRKRPDLAAGVAVRSLLSMLVRNNGAFMWKMNTGMGDAIFAPLYHVLDARNVDFRFFHWVDKLGLDDDGNRVARIEVKKQATLACEKYEPLVDLHGAWCWPSQPRWNLLQGDERLDLEQAPKAEVKSVDVTDFDYVVLALPAGVHDTVCAELKVEDSERFGTMVETWSRNTVGTRALQLWLTGEVDPPGPAEKKSVAGAFDADFDTIADMTQVLPQECWPVGARPAYLAYLCSVLPKVKHYSLKPRPTDNPLLVPESDFDVKMLRNLWPGFAADDLWKPPDEPAAGPNPNLLRHQYFRENKRPHELYVLSRAKDVRKRLDEKYDHFENLVLAGDWTKTGIDAGCIEAAVVSGRRAGREVLRRIAKESAPADQDPGVDEGAAPPAGGEAADP
jgi:uncharacterized protein with NAD-binding domain and iron-sulfur cluster